MLPVPASRFFGLRDAEPIEAGSPRTRAITTANDLVDVVEDLIRRGVLQRGDRLPSVRQAASELGLAPNTVASAYRRLRERGAVIGRGRQGTQVAPSRPPGRRTSVVRPPGVVDAMSGNPDPQLLPDLTPAFHAALAGPRADYGSSIVTPEMARAARRWLAADGIPSDAVTLTSGAMDAIERVLAEHLRPGDRVGVEDPGHVPVFDVVAALGLEPIPMPVDAQGVTPPALAAALDRGARAIIITPRAHNPTGAALTTDRAEDLAATLARYPEVLVIEDDHAGPVSGVTLAPLPRDRARWALVRSVAKSFGPDLRLAVLTGDEATVAAVEARHRAGPGWVSHLLQAAVVHLLDDPETTTLVDHAATTYRRRRHRLIDALAEAGVEATGNSGLAVWIPVGDEQYVADAVRDAGFAIRVGSAYRHTSPPAVRVTVSSLDDDQLDQVAAQLVAILGDGSERRSNQV